MKNAVQIEHRASSSRSKHEGESSFGLCDRLSRTRDNSQRQLPTDQDYAVSTREYQTDQSSLKTAPAAARSVLDERPKRRQQQTHRLRRLTRSLHIRPYNNIMVGDPDDLKPGEHFNYPVFKGFYAGVRWLQLNTSEGPITAMVDQHRDSPIYVQVFTPKTPPSNLVGQTAVPIPNAGSEEHTSELQPR